MAPSWTPTRLCPADLGAGTDLAAALKASRETVAVALAETGAVWLEGFTVPDARSFSAVVTAWAGVPRRYVFGQSDREHVLAGVYTASRYPAREAVPLHGELSYRAHPPRWILLHCETPAQQGGETPLLCGAALANALPPALVARFEARGLCYQKYMHGGGAGPQLGRSWQEHMETTDLDEAVALLEADGCAVTPTPDGGLRVSFSRPALRSHPQAGRVWAAQAALWHPARLGSRGAQLQRLAGAERMPTSVCHADGTPVRTEDIETLLTVAGELAVCRPWQAGAVALVDNWRVLHGRSPYTGTRRVHVALADGP